MADNGKAKRAKRAEHDYLDASGAVVDEQEAATGCRYKDVATGKVADFQVLGVKAGSVAAMLAAFGLKTLMTNTASGNRNTPTGESTGIDDVTAIVNRLGELKDGQWAAPSEGGVRGPKYDNAVLATIFAEFMEKKGKTVDVAKVEEKLTDDSGWKRGVLAAEIRKGWTVRDEYAKRQGIEAGPKKSLDDLAAGL